MKANRLSRTPIRHFTFGEMNKSVTEACGGAQVRFSHHRPLLNGRQKYKQEQTARTYILFCFLNTFIFNVCTSFNLLCRSEVLQAFCSVTMAI